MKAVAEKAKKTKHCKRADSSSDESDHPLLQDEDRVRRYKCFSHNTQLAIREHDIFGYQHQFEDFVDVPEG